MGLDRLPRPGEGTQLPQGNWVQWDGAGAAMWHYPESSPFMQMHGCNFPRGRGHLSKNMGHAKPRGCSLHPCQVLGGLETVPAACGCPGINAVCPLRLPGEIPREHKTNVFCTGVSPGPVLPPLRSSGNTLPPLHPTGTPGLPGARPWPSSGRRWLTTKSGSVSQSSPCASTFTDTSCPTTDFHICMGRAQHHG